MLKVLIFTSIVLILQTISLSSANVCYSVDDPHMKTFMGSPYEFHYDGSHFILYTDFRETRITAGYQKCDYNAARCNCAVHVKKGDKLAFIDFCKIKEYKSPVNRFYSVSKTPQNTYGPEAIKPINCKPILPIQEDDEHAWKSIAPANEYFKCAQIGDGTFVTYVLRTFDERLPGDSIKVKVDVGPLSMPRIFITPAINSFKNTGGLCGLWNNDTRKDLYVIDNNGDQKFGVSIEDAKDFWRMDSSWMPRCPGCFAKAERRLYCPCDNFSLTEDLNQNYTKNPYCDVLLPSCVEKSLNFPTSPITEDVINPTISTASPVTGSTGRPPISEQNANQMCSNAILNHPGLKPLIEVGVFDPTDSIHNCVQDILLTNNVNEMIHLHIELSVITALQNVLHNETYYINGTITDAGIAILIHLCPLGCNDNGICVINQNCISFNNKQDDKILECISPVKCECNANWGGPGCGQTILDPPDFFLSQTCCDAKNYKCERIKGHGYPFPRRTKLHYKILFSETNSLTHEGIITGLATVISENEFQINLPLKDLWLHNTSVVDVSIGISYNGNRFKYQNLQIYDSKCRFCDGLVSDQEIKPNTCIIENTCYNNGEKENDNEDNICDSANSIFDWTFIGYIPPFCNQQTHEWSKWFNLDDPSGDGDIEILPLRDDLRCEATALEVFTIDDIPAIKTSQSFYQDLVYGFICLNNEQVNRQCLDYKIRQCCEKKPTSTTTLSPTVSTIADCTVTLALTDSPILVKENEGSVRIKLFRPSVNSCNLNQELKVEYHTVPFSATTNNFVMTAGTILLRPGDTLKEIEILIIDNNLIEPFKFFKLIIDKASIDDYIIENIEQIIYIQDDDYGKPGATIGNVFDLMKRDHAERNINVAILNQIVPDPYDICPGFGGLSSNEPQMEFFLEFLDSLYEVFTVEIHNPAICNLKHMFGILMDRYGDPINSNLLESLEIDDQVFIDFMYPKNILKINENKIDKVEAIKIDFDVTKDGNNPSQCEVRVFGKKTSGKKNDKN